MTAVQNFFVSAWRLFKRLTALGFPRQFPIIQFPNLPLIIAILAGFGSRHIGGIGHDYLLAGAYLGMTVWAYEELVAGVNWFRRLLGVAYIIILIMRVAHGLHR